MTTAELSAPRLSDESLAEQALELDRLRQRVADAQAGTGKLDSALVAEFAKAQRAFLEAKIQLEQMRKAGLLAEPEPEPLETLAAEAEAIAAPEHDLAAPAAAESGRLLSASRVFWLLVILLLTALLWFMRSKFAAM